MICKKKLIVINALAAKFCWKGMLREAWGLFDAVSDSMKLVKPA